MVSPEPGAFNGATTKESWKADCAVVSAAIAEPSFNGATTKESWKAADRPRRVADGHRRFNGATTKESWKASITCSAIDAVSALQWGHDEGVVEGNSGPS